MTEATVKRRPNWSEEERLILVDEVNKRQDIIFGKFKGTVKGTRVKEQAWEEVMEILNAKSGQVKRTVEEGKKQFANLKQRAKEKSDAIRRPKTGGGPKPPSPSQPEAAILDAMADKPTLMGLDCGLDTEDPDCGTQPPTVEIPTTCDNDIPVQLDVIINDLGILQVPSSSGSNIMTSSSSTEPPKKRRKIQDEELLTLQAEKEKYYQEIKKLKEETEYYRYKTLVAKLKKEKIELEIEMLRNKCPTTVNES